MTPSVHKQQRLVHDALDAVRHAVPRDLVRNVMYYIDNAQDPELAIDVLVDGVIEGRVLLALEEFERIRFALDSCGRSLDRRIEWLEEHGMRPLASSEEED